LATVRSIDYNKILQFESTPKTSFVVMKKGEESAISMEHASLALFFSGPGGFPPDKGKTRN
jgi:hypothetical protein